MEKFRPPRDEEDYAQKVLWGARKCITARRARIWTWVLKMLNQGE